MLGSRLRVRERSCKLPFGGTDDPSQRDAGMKRLERLAVAVFLILAVTGHRGSMAAAEGASPEGAAKAERLEVVYYYLPG